MLPLSHYSFIAHHLELGHCVHVTLYRRTGRSLQENTTDPQSLRLLKSSLKTVRYLLSSICGLCCACLPFRPEASLSSTATPEGPWGEIYPRLRIVHTSIPSQRACARTLSLSLSLCCRYLLDWQLAGEVWPHRNTLSSFLQH